MKRNEAEFIVNIPQDGEEPLRGKFRVKVKLSYREILNMDSIRRQLIGPGGGEADGMATLVSSGLAKIRTHVIDAPSWWKDSNEGLDFDDIKVVLTILDEINKVERDHLADLAKRAEKATEELKETK
jgi:hypothetical protein